MRTLFFCLFLAPLLLAQKAPNSPDNGWSLTFDDEFDGRELDLSRWIPHDPRKPTSSVALEAVIVSGGQLHLSETISTFGLFAQRFGRFEVRFRTPTGGGSRPRLALLPVPSGELPAIDIFEMKGDTRKLLLANRWGTEQTARSYGDSFAVPDLSIGFHTIAIEWERARITWFIDGKKTFESTDGIPQQEMYLLIGDDDAQSTSPFDIDYVRVYKRPNVE